MRAHIFDMDGTLLRSNDSLVELEQRFASGAATAAEFARRHRRRGIRSDGRLPRGDSSRWVARLFAETRSIRGVEEDAAILRALERSRFPAERCAHPEPVSGFLGQSVLVTEFLEDHGPLRPGRAAAILGVLLGRLHAHPATNLRPGGAWHHLSVVGGPREEIAAAAELLDDHLRNVGVRELGLFDRLRDEVARTDDCHDLPHAFVHPDFVAANAVSTADGKLAIFDWTGAGRGPRLWSIGFLLWAVGARDLRLIDVVVSRYRRSVELDPAELARLEDAIRGRPVMLESWSVCAGRRELAAAVDRIERAGELAHSIAVEARRSFSTPIGDRTGGTGSQPEGGDPALFHP